MAWMQSRTNANAPPELTSLRGGGGSAPSSRTVMFMPDSPSRSASTRPLNIAPVVGQLRDWEGFMASEQAAASYAAMARDAAQRSSSGPLAWTTPPVVKREGPPSVAVLSPSKAAAEAALQQGAVPTHSSFSAVGPDGVTMLDNQTYIAWRRREYARRLEAEQRGAEFKPKPFSETFARSVANSNNWDPRLTPLDFEGRSKATLPTQVVGTRDELAWLHPPQIPPPLGWNEFWDLCAGHELLLQLMAVSGVTPANSPSLVRHFMYQELLSCVQRMQYGTYLLHYGPGEPPHERYFYLKSLPLANKAQYCPFLCWATHKNAHQAIDCIPLCNVMWVTTGADTPRLKKYSVGDGEHIFGPHVGKHRIQALNYGAFAVWLFDGSRIRCLELLATDPLVFTMWMKLLEDCAQLNAAVDMSGEVRRLQRQIEELRVRDELDQLIVESQPSSYSGRGIIATLFGAPRDY